MEEYSNVEDILLEANEELLVEFGLFKNN